MHIGQIVRYRLSPADAATINARRKNNSGLENSGPVEEGQVVPMLITAVHDHRPDSRVNGKLFLDGMDTFWVAHVRNCMANYDEPGTFDEELE